MIGKSRKAKIGEAFVYGYHVIIEDDVIIDDDVEIGHNVVIRSCVRIGNNCKILDGAILGIRPAKASLSAITGETKEYLPLVLGRAVTVGASSILYAGAEIGDMVFFGDQATVREDVTIGEYTIIGRGATIENKVTIGRKCKVETEAYITAMTTIEDYCFIAPEVTFTNDNFLGRTEERKKHFGGPVLRRSARIGANAIILPGLEIGADAVVAAGSIVIKDVEALSIPQAAFSTLTSSLAGILRQTTAKERETR